MADEDRRSTRWNAAELDGIIGHYFRYAWRRTGAAALCEGAASRRAHGVGVLDNVPIVKPTVPDGHDVFVPTPVVTPRRANCQTGSGARTACIAAPHTKRAVCYRPCSGLAEL